MVKNNMNKEEILKKAIEKAVKNNWEIVNQKVVDYEIDEFDNIFLFWNDMNIQFDILEIIFSHDFAKAFWGKNEIIHTGTYEEFWEDGDGYIDGGDEIELPAWQYHLQQMVLEEDKIKYLEKFI